MKIRFTSEKVASNPSRAIKNKNITNESLNNESKRFKFDNVPSVFMNNPDWTKVSHEIITNFENDTNDQKDVDFAYSDMCNKLFEEADKHLDFYSATKALRKRFKYHKPWWSTELTTLWKSMKDKEKQYLTQNKSHCNNNIHYQSLKSAREKFDKTLRKTERAYSEKFTSKLESLTTKNPWEFWNTIKLMGPRKQDIPSAVYKNDSDELTYDIEYVKNKWKHDFDGLYRRSNEATSDFHQDIKKYSLKTKY